MGGTDGRIGGVGCAPDRAVPAPDCPALPGSLIGLLRESLATIQASARYPHRSVVGEDRPVCSHCPHPERTTGDVVDELVASRTGHRHGIPEYPGTVVDPLTPSADQATRG